MMISHIAPVGSGQVAPIPALTCPDTPELELPSSHSSGYGSQSSHATSRTWPSSTSWILV